MKYILASQSPRRRELLARTGLEFEVIPSDVDEKITKEIPSDVVMELAHQKAENVYGKITDLNDYTVIGSDTIVVYRDEILGKPVDKQEAYDMLNNFRNNSKEFQKFTLLNGMAMNEMNTQLMMDVNNTVIGKGKDGKQVELVPVVGVGPNGVTQPMYSVPGSNQQFSREQLAEMGITDLMKATDARKEKMDNRRLDMEDRRIGLYGQALSLRGNKGRSPKASDLNAFNRMVDATLAQMGYGKTSKGYAKMWGKIMQK